MMDDLRELYQEMILDHYKNPRNFGKSFEANRSAEGYNPLCGDQVTIYLLVDGEVVREVAFEGSGCAICTASTSVMTEEIKNKTMAEAEALFGRFHNMVTADPGDDPPAGLGKLAVFGGVRDYPIRIKCATLPWHTMLAALANASEQVTTE